MSIMFRPPVAPVRVIGWRQVLGFAQAADPFWGQVRAAQLVILNRSVPFNLIVLGLNVVALIIVLRDIGQASFLFGWSLGLAVLLALRLAGWRARRAAVANSAVGIAEFWRVSVEMVGYGIFWAALMLHLLPRSPVEIQALLMLISLIAMGACAFAAAITPAAGTLLILTIAAGSFGLPAHSPLANPTLILGLLSFVVLTTRGMMVTCRGLMVRMATEADSAEQGAVIRLLLSEFESHGSDWLFEVDAAGLLTRVSPRFVEVTGRSHEALVGAPMQALLGDDRRGRESRDAVRQLDTYFLNRQSFRDLVIPVPAGEATRWWQLSGTPKYDDTGLFTGYRGVGSDVTDARLAEEHIVRLARFDSLTGLPNRRGIRDRIGEALRTARRTGSACAVLFIDLDRFKLVNDSLGHRTGDLLLCEVAGRLRDTLGDAAEIGRLGGDEFAVVLPVSDDRAAERAARVIVAALAQPFAVDEHVVSIGASVGFALGPTDGASVDLLLRSADLALYEVKGSGRGHACRFVPAIQAKAEERGALE
ncbi:MAG: GGDEF domain-containing protein, partial [Pseudomonadota bacterium]|nr:GGDEF domain-containing protein [Pseudomonadota bacterium]